MRVRVRPDRLHIHPTYRRVGHTFGREWSEIADGALRPEQIAYLTSDASRGYLEFEGDPPKAATAEPGTPSEAVAAAHAAGVSLPGHPTQPEANRLTREEHGEDDTGRTRRTRR